MKEARIDADTAERMLRGEHTGPPELVELLAAVSSGLTVDDRRGEEAAVAAFHEMRSLRSRQSRRRRLSALVSLKAALIGVLVLLAGGVAVAATSQHLPGPLGNKHSHSSRTPSTSQTLVAPSPTPTPSRSPQGHHRKQTKPGPQETHLKEQSHHSMKPKTDHRNNSHTPGWATKSAPMPSDVPSTKVSKGGGPGIRPDPPGSSDQELPTETPTDPST